MIEEGGANAPPFLLTWAVARPGQIKNLSNMTLRYHYDLTLKKILFYQNKDYDTLPILNGRGVMNPPYIYIIHIYTLRYPQIPRHFILIKNNPIIGHFITI